jgi:Fic family protein
LDILKATINNPSVDTSSYAAQTPWITFSFQSSLIPATLRMGEAYSKCEHLGQSLVPPTVVEQLTQIYLARGALASTAIEGNTLSESQAIDIIKGEADIPRSQGYLERELLNVAGAIADIDATARVGERFFLTPEWIKEQNRRVLSGLEVAEHVVPGEYTTTQLVVGTYRAAHPRAVEQYVDELCAWIERDWLAPSRDSSVSPEIRFAYRFHAAVLAHLYTAWIHPFGDGNGRTARLVECAILAHSDLVPWISSNLLSDHYNKTRNRYYEKLAAASQRGDVQGFIAYSAEGFADQLREQISEIRQWVKFATWTHYVHEVMHDEPSGPSKDRRRDLALHLANRNQGPVRKAKIPELNPILARAYATKSTKTVSRDISRLLELKLVREIPDRAGPLYGSTIATLEAFRPFGTVPDSGGHGAHTNS